MTMTPTRTRRRLVVPDDVYFDHQDDDDDDDEDAFRSSDASRIARSISNDDACDDGCAKKKR